VDTVEELSTQLAAMQDGIIATLTMLEHKTEANTNQLLGENSARHEELVNQMITANQALSAILNIASGASQPPPPAQQPSNQAQRNRYAMSGVGSISNS
jgi:predicted phage-related endonuclease